VRLPPGPLRDQVSNGWHEIDRHVHRGVRLWLVGLVILGHCLVIGLLLVVSERILSIVRDHRGAHVHSVEKKIASGARHRRGAAYDPTACVEPSLILARIRGRPPRLALQDAQILVSGSSSPIELPMNQRS
jgi:hypothetical protein